MTASAQKNSIVLGYVSYFVGISFLGFAIYRWSQPIVESKHVHIQKIHSEESSGAVVSYENDFENESSESQDLVPQESLENSNVNDLGAETETKESAPAEEEWN